MEPDITDRNRRNLRKTKEPYGGPKPSLVAEEGVKATKSTVDVLA